MHLTGMEVCGKGHECECRGPSHGRTVRVGRVGSMGPLGKPVLLREKRRLLASTRGAHTGRGTLVIPTLLLSSRPLSG